ncbi:hypothetical protein SDC9_118021 [bioreactor metagenome]|jgi:hypothetical protein|uniref:Transposase n=1 Tax=bioreactor metagenome TaxID=1076179 RepID=A0A645C155_9ZZZZ
MQTSGYSLLLPTGMLEYFEITEVKENGNSVDIYLTELNIIPSEYKNDKLQSKGFYEEITINDFPIRGKRLLLHIKRRKWLNESTGDIVNRDWELVAKGTRMTQEFASFLKGYLR